jgi:hypothetical protein
MQMTVVSEQQLPVDDTLTTIGGDTVRRVLATLNGESHDVTILPDEVDMDTYANASRKYLGLKADGYTYIMTVSTACEEVLKQEYQTLFGTKGRPRVPLHGDDGGVSVWFSLKKSDSGESYVQMMLRNTESLDDRWKGVIFPKKGGWRITMASHSLRDLVFGRGTMDTSSPLVLSPVKSRPSTPHKPQTPIAETVEKMVYYGATPGSQNENIDPFIDPSTQEKRNPNTPFGNDVAASLGFAERGSESPRQLKETLDMARAYTEENDTVDGNPPIRQGGQDIGVVVGTPVCVQGIPIDMYGVIPQPFHVPAGGYPVGSVMQAPPLHVPAGGYPMGSVMQAPPLPVPTGGYPIFDLDGPEMQVLDDLASIQNVPDLDGPVSPGCQRFLEGLMSQSEESQRSNKRLRRDASTMEALEVDVYGVNTKKKIEVIKSVCITPLSEEVKTKFIQEILDGAAAAVLRDNIYVSVWVRDAVHYKISTCHVSSKEGGANFTLKNEVYAREHRTWKEGGGKKLSVFYFPLVLKQYRIIVCAVCTGDDMNENPFLSLCTDGCLLQENVDICQKPYRKDQIKVPFPYFANVTLSETRKNFLFK